MDCILKTFLETVDYEISESGSFSWNCFPDARYYDFINEVAAFGIVFNTKTLEVLELNLDSESEYQFEPVSYRWVNPKYLEAYKNEHAIRGLDFKDSGYERSTIDLEVLEDIFEKATAMIANKDFDRRVEIVLDLDEDLLDYLFREAHRRDITFNRLLESIIREACEEASKG